MADVDIQLRAMNVLVHMHTAIKNIRLYPLASPIVINSIDKLYTLLPDILSYESPLVFAESEKKALLRGRLLNQKDQETNHVAVLLDILICLGVKGIFFDKGLEKDELRTFIKLIAQNPEAIRDAGGLHRLMEKNNLVHIYLDKNVSAAMHKEKETIAGDDGSPKFQGAEDQDDIVGRLMDNLLSENTDTRVQASGELAKIIESVPAKQQQDILRILSRQLVAWIKLETAVTPAYKKICHGLQTLLHDLIRQERFTDVIPVMDVFSKISTGELIKDAKAREVSTEVLRNLASENNLNILFKKLNTGDKNKEDAVDRILSGFGDLILNKLLDIVRDVKDSNERVRVIHLIEAMGQRAIPAINDRINSSVPWYYLRNLAYILGHIGNEQDAHILQPLLLHNNDKVRVEALKSISQTGGKQRGALLLSVLPQADDPLRLSIIEMLGKIKYTGAVTYLLEMLKNKSLITKDGTISIQEKICNALGAIGSSEAIPALSEIAESKSFLGIRSYPVEVKYAAKRALASIKRIQEENAGS
jgi:HEAT repeat protein